MIYHLIIKQIIVGNLKNFTYVLADKDTRDGVIIDPSWDIDKVIAIIRKDQLKNLKRMVYLYGERLPIQ